MGIMEERSRVKRRRSGLKRAILQTVAAAGIISLAIAAPNVPRGIPRSWLRAIFDRPRSSRDVAIAKLVAEGLLMREKHNGRSVLRITAKGKRHLSESGIARQSALAKPKRWDRKWRVVIFDIREPFRKVRDALRRELRATGFYRLQDSVWIYPYPCEDYIVLLKADMRVGKDILYLIVDEIENERHLKEYFDLE